MAKAPKPRNLPLKVELGGRIGNGQDNSVYQTLNPAEKPHLRVPTGWVLKLSHDIDGKGYTKRPRHEDPREASWRGIQYKKHKYDLLKHFLGDNIPQTEFIMTKVQDGGKERYVEMMLQREVPQVTLNQLSAEQRKDPRLHANMQSLVKRMQYMYKILGEVNARTAHGINLDAKLDLGGISDRVRAEDLDHQFTDDETDDVIDSTKSPNLLVDPESMQLYCIDFDQGQWEPGMDEAKTMAFEIDARRQRHNAQAFHVGAVALG